MTEKEFEQIRNSYHGRQNKYQDTKSSSGYFSYFKIRCLICLIILLSVLILDRQIGLKQFNEVAVCLQLIEMDDLSVKECFNMVISAD